MNKNIRISDNSIVSHNNQALFKPEELSFFLNVLPGQSSFKREHKCKKLSYCLHCTKISEVILTFSTQLRFYIHLREFTPKYSIINRIYMSNDVITILFKMLSLSISEKISSYSGSISENVSFYNKMSEEYDLESFIENVNLFDRVRDSAKKYLTLCSDNNLGKINEEEMKEYFPETFYIMRKQKNQVDEFFNLIPKNENRFICKKCNGNIRPNNKMINIHCDNECDDNYHQGCLSQKIVSCPICKNNLKYIRFYEKQRDEIYTETLFEDNSQLEIENLKEEIKLLSQDNIKICDKIEDTLGIPELFQDIKEFSEKLNGFSQNITTGQ